MIRNLIFLVAFLGYTPGLAAQESPETEHPVNIIILIGDGMGLAQLSVPYYYQKKEPVFTNFNYVGLVKTSSLSHKVTGSGAAATAMFTGRKTYNSAIGVDKDTIPHKNLVEILSEMGYKTGVIATSSITDATPAGFFAHESHREKQREIARDLIYSDIDFFAGGGLQYFVETTGRDLFKENNMEVNFSKLRSIRNPEEGKRYGFLLAYDAMPAMVDGRGRYLSKAITIATEYLSIGNTGFILMIEGSQIDWAAHSNNPDYLISEINDFETGVEAAYDFAVEDGNTLIIVTSDHETGGFALSASGSERYGTDYNTLTPKFSTTDHSATLVPLLAYGTGAVSFSGIYENSDIFYKIIDVVTSGNK